jgi:hypothetical protein
MTTYGPRRLSLLERLVSADAVVLIRAARLLGSELDELSEGRREIGLFELSIAETLDGDVSEDAHVRVVRDAEGSWPFADKGLQLALLQRGPTDREWFLVHGSAYALRRDTFIFRDAIDPHDRSTSSERVTIDGVRQLVKDRRARVRKADSDLIEHEGRQLRKVPKLPSEMPETSDMTAWLDVEKGQGGREGELGGASTEISPNRRRKPASRRSTRKR